MLTDNTSSMATVRPIRTRRMPGIIARRTRHQQ
jgi:hypothetical protein